MNPQRALRANSSPTSPSCLPTPLIGHCSTRICPTGIVNLWSLHAVWQSHSMDILPVTKKYKNHRFPVEIISHAVWLYFRFCLSFRDVEELLLERGVVVTYEAIRKWCRKF